MTEGTFDFALFFAAFVALLALVNPIQKIFLMTSLKGQLTDKELSILAYKSTFAAFLILLLFLSLGNVIFNYIFHIQLYAFRITCGLVLVFNGFDSLQKGIMIRMEKGIKVRDVSAVPVAMPMIAGPGAITAAVTFPNQYGLLVTISALMLALLVNYCCMYFAGFAGKLLARLNLMSALVRILGLIIATIGVQMISTGLIELLQEAGVI